MSMSSNVQNKGNDTYQVTELNYQSRDDSKFPSIGARLAGWVPDTVTVKGDRDAASVAAVDKVYDEQYTHFDHTRDVVPIYVRLDQADQTTVANNNASLFNYAMPVIAKFVQQGTTDDAWNQFERQIKSLDVDQNVQLWQKAYDNYVK